MDRVSETPNSEGDDQIRRKNWLSDLGLDAAKLGLLLYVLGLLASSLYYSRFSIATLDLAKMQSILLGIYVVLFYMGLPAAALFCLRKVNSVVVVTIVFIVVLCLADAALAFALAYRARMMTAVAGLMLLLQFFLFVDFTSLWRSILTHRLLIPFVLPPSRLKSFIFAVLFCFHFSQFCFPRIPAFLGGGRPLPVQVFTKTQDLPSNRFFISKNQPKINSAIDSFSLKLLYETDKDVYFVNDLQSGDSLIGYSVMRLSRDEILRIDYVTPKWVKWKGEP